MINTGTQLREARERLGISQARLSEITGLSRHQLSSFELEKSTLPEANLGEINSILPKLSDFSEVLNRKKRYRSHTYRDAIVDNERLKKHSQSAGNVDYLKALKALECPDSQRCNAISFFSGIGGFSLGFKSAGFNVRGFVEIDDGLAKMYQKNFPKAERLGSDITEISSEKLANFRKLIGEVDVVIGGPPCQGFSLSGKRKVDDPRNYLFQDYLRAIDVLQPKFAIVENVRLLTSMRSKNGGLVKDEIAEGLKNHGYKAKLFAVNAKDYGAPQHRERAIFIAVRGDLEIDPSFPLATHTAGESHMA